MGRLLRLVQEASALRGQAGSLNLQVHALVVEHNPLLGQIRAAAIKEHLRAPKREVNKL